MSTPLLRRAGRRFLLGHPWQTVLAALGIAGGVASVAGIGLASAGAERAFALAVEAVAGPAGYEVARDGGTLDERWYVRARAQPASPPLVPVVEGWVTLADERPGGGRRVRLVGIDPLAAPLAGRATGRSPSGDAPAGHRLPPGGLLAPATALLGRDLVPSAGLGDPVAVEGASGVVSLTVIGRLAGGGAAAEAAAGRLVVDIATAQELLDLVGRLSRVEVLVPATGDAGGQAGDRGLAALRADLPAGATLRSKSERTAMLSEMTRAFRLNLRALSWLAMLVGAFLVYSTMSFSVLRRRAWIGLVRALGASRGEIGRLVIGDALLVGLAGTVVGLVVGSLLAHGLTGLVLRTVNDLYFAVEVRQATLHVGPLVVSAALGLAISGLAAAVPAWEAMRVPPRTAQLRSLPEARALRRLPALSLAGGMLMLLAGALVVLVPRGLAAGFAAVLVAVLGAALLVPGATVIALRAAAPLLRGTAGTLGSLAARSVVAGLSRTGVALAALVVATAAAAGVGIMVHSFRTTVVAWLDVTLQADVYVTAPVARRGRSRLPPAVVEALRTTPGVAHAARTFRGTAGSPVGPLPVVALDPGPGALRTFRLVEGDPTAAYDALVERGAVLVSVPLAYRLGIGTGDRLALATAAGCGPFAVAGVFDDFGSDRGTAVMSRATFSRCVGPPGVQAVALFAAADTDRGELQQRIEARLASLGVAEQLEVIPSGAIRERSLAIFDRTFEITRVLRLIALGIAFVGVVSSLLALESERRRERAILRALGLTPRQVGALITAQSLLMGLCAGLLAAPVAAMLAWLLVHVINRRAFGWTIQLSVAPAILVQALVLALLAALVAGAVPASRAGAVSPTAALREE